MIRSDLNQQPPRKRLDECYRRAPVIPDSGAIVAIQSEVVHHRE